MRKVNIISWYFVRDNGFYRFVILSGRYHLMFSGYGIKWEWKKKSFRDAITK